MPAYQKQWKVPSKSHPDKPYTVSLTVDGAYICHCWPFLRTRKECDHIRDVKDGLYDTVPEWNFVLTVGRQVELDSEPNTVLIPLRPMEDTDFYATILYDLLKLGVPWRQIKEKYAYDLDRSWTPMNIYSHVLTHGRKIFNEEQPEIGPRKFDRIFIF